jgi:predicted kinase
MKQLKEFINSISKEVSPKAIFVSGGPSSGKDIIIREIREIPYITEMNLTQAFNYLSDKDKLIEDVDHRVEAIRNRDTLIINASAYDQERINYVKEELEELDYQPLMVFVNTTNESSKERNKRLSRVMKESVRHDKWVLSQENKDIFEQSFEYYIEFNNDESIDYLKEDINQVKDYIYDFVKEAVLRKSKLKADGPCDITPDNRMGATLRDDPKSDMPTKKPNKTVSYGTWSSIYGESAPTLKVSPDPKIPNFQKDKDTERKKKKGDTSLRAGRVGKPDGIGSEYDTRAGGQGAAAGAGLGQHIGEDQDWTDAQPWRFASAPNTLQPNPLQDSKKDFKGFRKKLKKEWVGDGFGEPSMGVAGVCGGAGNKEGMDSYKDTNRNIGISIKKKKLKK